MPDLLDLADIDFAVVGENALEEARRDADAQGLRAEFEKRPALGRRGDIQEAGEIIADLRLGAFAELGDHLMERRQRGTLGGRRRRRPQMRDGLRHLAHIVIGHDEESGIDPLRHQIAHQRALEQLEAQLAGNRRHRPAAVGIGRMRRSSRAAALP